MATKQSGGRAAAIIAELKSVSADFAAAAVHVSRSFRMQLLAAGEQVRQGNLMEASSKLNRLSETKLVQALGGKLLHVKEEVGAVLDKLEKAGGPLVKIVGGLSAFAFGYFSAASLGAVLAGLLIVGGLLIAIEGGFALAHNGAALHLP